MMSNASGLNVHPLRQTSFPPDDPFSPGAVRSPSVDTMSLVSGSIAGEPGKKKRGRKPKNAEDTASLAGGLAPTAVSGVSGRGRASRGMTADEDDDVGGETAVAIVTRTKEEKEKEKQHRAMLVSAFDEDQFLRYEKWRSSKLSDAVVRRVRCDFQIDFIKLTSSLAHQSNALTICSCQCHLGCQVSDQDIRRRNHRGRKEGAVTVA